MHRTHHKFHHMHHRVLSPCSTFARLIFAFRHHCQRPALELGAVFLQRIGRRLFRVELDIDVAEWLPRRLVVQNRDRVHLAARLELLLNFGFLGPEVHIPHKYATSIPFVLRDPALIQNGSRTAI